MAASVENYVPGCSQVDRKTSTWNEIQTCAQADSEKLTPLFDQQITGSV